MYLKSANSSGNYVFFDAMDIDSMKSIDRGYNCYKVEYKPEEIKDIEDTTVVQVPIVYTQSKFAFKFPMKHFSQFKIVNGKLQAKLHL